MTDFPDLKIKALVSFPAQVNGGTGIDVSRNGGIYTIDLDYSEFGTISALPANPNLYSLIFDTVLQSYVLAPVSLFGGGGGGGGGGLADAPIDGFNYGRNSATWQRVVSLSGGTMTGPLILNADPTVALGSVTKQYVDAMGGFIQAGSGAVTRTMQDKAREWFSVTDFGAVGNNSTDCTAAFNAAIAAAAAATPQRGVLVPDGIFRVTSISNIPPNIYIKGA